MNKILIHHRSPHHANYSGYGRIMDYIDAQGVYGNTRFPYRIAKIIAALHSQAKGNYNSGSVLKAIELYGLLQKHSAEKNIVHFLNGERDIRHVGFLKREFPNTKFVATFHKPPTTLKKTIPNPAALKKLDGAIAVGANQVGFLKDWLQLENVTYIPHGVDTNFFVPDISKKKENTLLFVGQHLRDFKALNKTVPKIAAQIENLKINAVVHPAYSGKIKPHSCINILTGIEDIQLRALYQGATLLYLPMQDSTACNSLLEAMSCGLPIITSSVGGNPVYLEGTSNAMVESRNIEGLISKTIALMQDESRLREMGQSSRERAMDFEWINVVKDINGFYEQLD